MRYQRRRHEWLWTVGKKQTTWFPVIAFSSTFLIIFFQRYYSMITLCIMFALQIINVHYPFSSVQLSHSVVSDSLQPPESQHTRPPCPSPTPRVHPTHDHWVGDAIQPSHPLRSHSPPSLNLSQHQGLFQWVSSSLQIAKVLEFQLQHQSFQWTPRADLLQDGLDGSPCNPRDSQESSPAP